MGDDVIVGASPEAGAPPVMARIHCSITFLYTVLSSWPSVARARSMLHRSPIPDSWAQHWELEMNTAVNGN